jgi:hypothetical protein
VVLRSVVWNGVVRPLFTDPLSSLYLAFPPLLLGLWLLAKLSPRLAWVGNPVMAFLVGAGAAVAIGGAVVGTLFPQMNAATAGFELAGASLLDSQVVVQLVKAVIMLIITALTLLYFYFGVKPAADGSLQRPRWIQELASVGHIFIAMTFGVLFAGVYTTALTALIERLRAVLEVISRFIPAG